MSESADPNRFAPPRAVVDDAVDHHAAPVPARRGARLAAAAIDTSPWFVLGLVAAIALPAYFTWQRRQGGTGPGGAIAVMIGVGVLVLLVYAIVTAVFVFRHGQTVGKKIMGIRVARMDGSRVSFGRFLFLRNLPVTVLGMIPYLGWLVGLVDHVLIFRDSPRCWHDQIADTQVVTAASSPLATLAGSRRMPAPRFVVDTAG